MRTVKLFCHHLCFCCAYSSLNLSPHTDSQTAWENAVWLLQLTSREPANANSFPEHCLPPPIVRHQMAVRQSVSPGNLRLSGKWMIISD